MIRRASPVVVVTLLVAGIGAAGDSSSVYRDGFESPRPSWRQEDADVAVQLLHHERTEQTRHEGRRSEWFQFIARGPGSSVYYSLPLPRIPVVESLDVGLYVRSSQPGVQLLARVILPADTDPETGQPSFVQVAGTAIQDADRWTRLELANLSRAIEDQARIVRIKTRRKVPTTGAYLERLILNLYGGPGDSEVFVDDLQISPAPESLAAAPEQPGPSAVPSSPERAPSPASTPVRLEAGRLSREGRDWVPVILSAPGADLEATLPFRFDALAVGADAEVGRLRGLVGEAVLLMPNLAGVGGAQSDPTLAVQAAAACPLAEYVAFWDLGKGLGSDPDPERRKAELTRTRAIISGLRERPRSFPRLTTAVLRGELPKYVRPGQSLDLIGIDAQNWGFARDPAETLLYLKQRRQLTALVSVNALHWAALTAAAPRSLRTALWGEDPPPEWGRPRVQPEQLRLATYTAFMAGYRGIAYQADSDLTRAAGRAILYEMGLLNAEIDVVESILARGQDPITEFRGRLPDPKPVKSFNPNTTAPGFTYNPLRARPKAELPPHDSIRIAAIATPDARGRLLFVADLAPGAQWQPPQMGLHDLKLLVPGAADNAQAWEITLGGVRLLDRLGREPGGIAFTMPLFDTTALILLTSDFAQIERIKQAIQMLRPWAVNLAIKEAQIQLDWVRDTHERLTNDVGSFPEAPSWFALAQRSLQSANDALAREDYQLAWDEARSVLRFLRLIMRSHWDRSYEELVRVVTDRQASEGGDRPARPLVSPVASPALLAYNTLPQHALWCSWIRSSQFGDNLVPTGTFDATTPDGLAKVGWTDASYRDDKLDTSMRIVPAEGSAARDGDQVLRFRVAPADPSARDRTAAILDHPVAAVQSPPVAVLKHQLVRIRVKVRMRQRLASGSTGLVVRDSLGGELLQFRTTEPIPDWKEVVLFRRAPADGTVTVLLGLAGYGEAEYDDLRIDTLTGPPSPPQPSGPDVVDSTRPATPRPNPPVNPEPARRPSASGRFQVIR